MKKPKGKKPATKKRKEANDPATGEGGWDSFGKGLIIISLLLCGLTLMVYFTLHILRGNDEASIVNNLVEKENSTPHLRAGGPSTPLVVPASATLSPSPSATLPPAPYALESARTIEKLLLPPNSIVQYRSDCVILPSERAAFEGPDGSMPIRQGSSCSFNQPLEALGILRKELWSSGYVSSACEDIRLRSEGCEWGPAAVSLVRDALKKFSRMRRSRGLVWGSTLPWLECISIELGAHAVWAFEADVEQADFQMTPEQVIHVRDSRDAASHFIAGDARPFDWIASYAYLAAAGLGRDGEPLHADADLEALEQGYAMLSPGGYYLLFVPVACAPAGFVDFNVRRVYGYKRLAYIARGYEFLGFQSPCIPYTEHPQMTFLLFRKPLKEEEARDLRPEDFEVTS